MKVVLLLLCVFAVSCYGATSSLKFKLHNNVHQGEEEALLPAAPEEPVYSLGEPAPEEAAPAETTEASVAEEPVYSVGEPVYEAAPAAAPEEPVYSVGEPVYEAAPAATEEPVYSVGEPVYEAFPSAAPEQTNEETTYATEEPAYIVDEPLYQEDLAAAPEETPYVEEPVIEEVAPAPEPVPTYLPGGYHDVDASRLQTDDQLQAALDLGVDTLLQTAREDGKLGRNESPYTVKKINRIQQQTVAGINYKFDIVLENSENGRIYAEFTVFRGLDRTLTVQEGCLKVGRVIRI